MPFSYEISLIAPIALLLAFALLNLGKLTPDHYSYQWMNVIGAAALTYTTIKPLNVGVLVTEAIWTLIGLYGVYSIWRKRRAGAAAPNAAKTAS